MCGIFSTFDHTAINLFRKLKHRGPDLTQTIQITLKTEIPVDVFMGFHRLSIIGINNGSQPFQKDGVFLLCNGELYNYKELYKKYSFVAQTESDCEIMLHLYLNSKFEKFHEIRGEYAFIILDTRSNEIHYGRDRCGVRPLFISHDKKTLSSELKGLISGEQVEPNKIFTYNFKYGETSILQCKRFLYDFDFKKEFIKSIKLRLNSEVPIGFLLSGGFDSSIVLSIASEFLSKRKQKIYVFSIGFDESAPDIVFAKKVIEYLRNKYGDIYEHHVIISSFQEGIKVIPEVIQTIESFDTTTVRASTPMYLLAKYIKEKTDVKVVLSGEGSDELNGSYLYFHHAPSKDEFNEERKRLVNEIHYFDGLRADRTISAFSLELRVPFLDNHIVDYILDCDHIYDEFIKTRLEKQYIRMMFSEYLPDNILWRRKEAFSDAVSYNWKSAIKKSTEKFNIGYTPLFLIPTSNEEKWYRFVYDKYYYYSRCIPHLWLPKWIDTQGEPSATVLPEYDKIKN